MIRAFLVFLFALVPGCAVVPPSQSGGEITSPILQASWEAATPAVEGAEALDEALSACTGPLSFGVQAHDPLAIAQFCDCYRERHETDRHAYRHVCAPRGPAERPLTPAAANAEAPAPPACPAAPDRPDLRGDLDDALEGLRRTRSELAAERAETDALRVRAEALRRIGAGCRRVAGKDSYHQLDTTTWACSAEAVDALELAVTP